MAKNFHIVFGILATITICAFFISSIYVEIFSSHEAVARIKSLIVMPGLFILVPAIAVTGGSGFFLSKTRQGRFLELKKRRMPFIAGNGMLILVPCAIYLNSMASQGIYDSIFYLVQTLELIAGALNLALMGLNIRDGMKLSGLSRVQHVKELG